MPTRRRRVKKTCARCEQPVRQVRHARLCTGCFRKAGRPRQVCERCGTEYPADVFGVSGRGRTCPPCRSAAAHDKRVAETYGLEPGVYAELLAAQDGRCAICQNRPAKLRLAVDHNHDTDEVRGLLCKRCNHNLLGGAHDSIELLQRAIDYLTSPPARKILGDFQ